MLDDAIKKINHFGRVVANDSSVKKIDKDR
jgi:hypothetical protein